MQISQTPALIPLAFAATGAKNTIPEVSQIGITDGAASLPDGFPPLTGTPIASGGVPPFRADMNGILFALSAWSRWQSAGGGVAYSSSFASDSNVGGYPKGARVLRSDGTGYWLNQTENNTTNPDTGGAGWVPDVKYGITAITGLTNANVTLAASQYAKNIITLAGTLTANVQIIFPAIVGEWVVVNNTTGAFTVTCKTASGSGIAITQGTTSIIWGDATNIYATLADRGTLDALYAPLSTAVMLSAFTGSNQSLASSGYQKLPGGLIIQWVSANIPSGGQTISFPISFPNSVFAVIPGNVAATGSTFTSISMNTINTGSLYVYANGYTSVSGVIAVATSLFLIAVGR